MACKYRISDEVRMAVNRMLCHALGHRLIAIGTEVRWRQVGLEIWYDTYHVNHCTRCGFQERVCGETYKGHVGAKTLAQYMINRGLEA